MKKRKPIKLGPLFKKEKDLYSIVKNPEAVKRVIEMANAVEKTKTAAENLTKEAPDITEWYIRVIAMLPKDFKDKNPEFTVELSNLVDKYDDN